MQNIKDSTTHPEIATQNLLRIAECSSVAVSGIGVIISVISKQVVYAAAPLSISLFLSFLNRQKLEQTIESYIDSIQQNLAEKRPLTLEESIDSKLQYLESGISQQITQMQYESISLNNEIKKHFANSDKTHPYSTDIQESIAQINHQLSKLASIEALDQLKLELRQIQLEQKQEWENVRQDSNVNKSSLKQDVKLISKQLEEQVSTLNSMFEKQFQDLDYKVDQQAVQLQHNINFVESLHLDDRLKVLNLLLQSSYTNLLSLIASMEDQLNQLLEKSQIDIEQGQSSIQFNEAIEKLQLTVDKLRFDKPQLIQKDQPLINELEHGSARLKQHLEEIATAFKLVENIQAIGTATRPVVPLQYQCFQFLDVVKKVIDNWDENDADGSSFGSSSVSQSSPAEVVDVEQPLTDPHRVEYPGKIDRSRLNCSK
jgi:hypothetical protein